MVPVAGIEPATY